MMMKSNKHKGFTLIELMIVVAIMAILAAIGYPSYENYVLRSKRAEGRAALLDGAARQERYYSDNMQYGTRAQADLMDPSETGKYDIDVVLGAGNQTFTLQAKPLTFDDPDCGWLTINQAGVKGATGPKGAAECWNR